jgi:hypothetical protein
METHNVSVTKVTYRSMLINEVIPAICAKMPDPPSGAKVTIQQENAPPLISPSDPQFCQAARDAGNDIGLRF